MRVYLSPWAFHYPHDSPQECALRKIDPSLVPEPEHFSFPDVDALLRHLDGPGADDRSRFQGSINEQLKKNRDVKTIKQARTQLKDLKHFPKYRGRQYDNYHNAARSVEGGTGKEWERKLINGLDREIDGSNILLEQNQLLFHGRSNDLLIKERPYPSYVSTTLDPIVAINSALRRAGNNNANGRPIVFVLKLCISVPALWGHVGRSREWELLLPRRLSWTQTAFWSGITFDVAHASASCAR